MVAQIMFIVYGTFLPDRFAIASYNLDICIAKKESLPPNS